MTFIIKIEHMNSAKQIIVQLAFVCVDENKDFSIFFAFQNEISANKKA